MQRAQDCNKRKALSNDAAEDQRPNTMFTSHANATDFWYGSREEASMRHNKGCKTSIVEILVLQLKQALEASKALAPT